MPQHRVAMRGLSAVVTIALGLWIFGRPMPDMAGQASVAMAMPATAHAHGPAPAHAPRSDGGCGLCIGCCPGSATPPPNPLGLRFDAAPLVNEVSLLLAPSLPRQAVEHHWQPQPIGPPAPQVG
jgi:hypothetical protein